MAAAAAALQAFPSVTPLVVLIVTLYNTVEKWWRQIICFLEKSTWANFSESTCEKYMPTKNKKQKLGPVKR